MKTFHEMTVHVFVPNTGNKVVKETTTSRDDYGNLVLDEFGKPELTEQDIIPSRIEDDSQLAHVYQVIENNQAFGYFTEDGKPYVFVGLVDEFSDLTYETPITKYNVTPPSWAKSLEDQ